MGAWTRTVAASVIAAATAVAQDAPGQRQNYQIELSGGLTQSVTDTNPDLELTQFIAEGTYHFQPVSLQGHPWNEAAFLEHSMFVTAGLRYAQLELGPVDADGIVLGAGFRYATKESPIAAEINFSTGELSDSSFDVETTTVDLAVGYWLKSNFLIGVDFVADELDPDGPGSFEETSYGVFGKLVHDLGEKRAINLAAHVGQTSVDDGASDEDNLELLVEGDFYFTPRHSVGALLEFSSGDAVSEEGTTIGVRGSVWVTDKIGLRAEYTTFMASDDLGADVDQFGIFVDIWL